MFELYYEVLFPVYGSNLSLTYTDTDNLCIEVFTKDVYFDLKEKFNHILDFSNYPPSNNLHSKQNESSLGYLKDETKGTPIREFCALRPKMYYVFGNNKKQTAKGTKKSVIKTFNHELYINILENDSLMKNKQTSIVSKNHSISTVLQNKTSLSSFYDKMYLTDAIHCLPYGHYSIK